MRKWFVLLLLCIPSELLAGGSTVGNGGDDLALEFNGLLRTAWKQVSESRDPAFRALSGIDLGRALPLLKIVTVDDPLETDFDSIKQESAALNFPENQLILVNRARWSSIANAHLKEGLALHEALSLMGKESSGKYPYSAAYVASYGLGAGDLLQTYFFVGNVLEYRSGGDTFRIEARERLDHGSKFFSDIRIEYVVKRNGRLLKSMSDQGGLMLSCTYGDPTDPATLPKQFLELAGGNGKPFGFFVHGLGICGNTTSGRSQLIVPGESTYRMQEFVHKTPIQVRQSGGRSEIWFLDQVWGACGTSGSFFVPNLFLIDREGNIRRSPLPASPEAIPSFDPFQFDLFHAYYLDGMRTFHSPSIALAAQYFPSVPDLGDWNASCGLPSTVEEVRAMEAAMRTLGTQLPLFHRTL